MSSIYINPPLMNFITIKSPAVSTVNVQQKRYGLASIHSPSLTNMKAIFLSYSYLRYGGKRKIDKRNNFYTDKSITRVTLRRFCYCSCACNTFCNPIKVNHMQKNCWVFFVLFLVGGLIFY